MQKMDIRLSNCFGISQLNTSLNFSEGESTWNNVVVYAPNGTMKTSFTKIFQKIQNDKEIDIQDYIFGGEVIYDIKIDGDKIKPEEIFVIPSFESYYQSDNMANLLIDDNLKKELGDILKLRDKIFKELEKMSGLKVTKSRNPELETVLLQDFNIDSFLQNLEVFLGGGNEDQFDFSDVSYINIFDASVIKKIQDSNFQSKIQDYINKSKEIYSGYKFFEKGKFSLGKLKNATKDLQKSNFFVGDNKVQLTNEENLFDLKALNEKIIEIEEKLKESNEFQNIEKLLSDSKGLVLKDIIENNPDIIQELKNSNLINFRKKLWISYFKKINNFQDLKNKFEVFLEKLKGINFESSLWFKAYKVFEERFIVPFEMQIENAKSVILGETIPRITFKFKKDGKEVIKDRNFIEDNILSQGEKRALYLLNIIFEIENLKRKEVDRMIFIIDDIADSFDYKNKYAIIEYLKEISEENNFYQIILTHNFDFYRTIQDRVLINKWKSSYFVNKTKNGIIFTETQFNNFTNPFYEWKKSPNNIQFISLIPFVRNLIEYIYGKNIDYKILTFCLHNKLLPSSDSVAPETKNITVRMVKDIFQKLLSNIKFDVLNFEDNDKIIDIIYNNAESLKKEFDEISLENKLGLSIAIRLKAEEFMWNRVSNKTNMEKMQTGQLFSRFKAEHSGEDEEIRILSRVNILTPENIHLNSFMYEPLLDMSLDSLKGLYEQVLSL